MSEVRVKWGGFCGSDPKYGKVVGYAQDLRTHEPLVLVVEDGVISKTRSLPEREVEVVGGEYPPEFVEAIATWTAGKPGPVQGGAAVTLHLDKDQAQTLVEALEALEELNGW